MINKKLFFDEYKKHLDKSLSQREVDAIDWFLDAVNKNFSYFTLIEWAYVFATTYHETEYTFEPVREAFRKTEDWRRRNLRYWPLYGRGYCQLTWPKNYTRASKLLGLDLVKNPDLAMVPENAFLIMIDGMKKGWYTGVSLSKYIKDGKPDYLNMRRVINGNDRAEVISDYAREFQRILNVSTK